MKTFKALFVAICLLCLTANISLAASSKKSKKPKVRVSKVSTDIKFDDHVIGGQYPKALESITTVENEKDLDDLLGVRKDFKDRLKQSESRR